MEDTTVTTQTFKLIRAVGHLFLVYEKGEHWLIDTGAWETMGDRKELTIAGRTFPVMTNGPVTGKTISDLIGKRCAGLIGLSILNQFNTCFDAPAEEITFYQLGELPKVNGLLGSIIPYKPMPISVFVEVPELNETLNVIFDTGSFVSYLPDEVIDKFPSSKIGEGEDAHPVCGKWKTEIYDLKLRLGNHEFRDKCARQNQLRKAVDKQMPVFLMFPHLVGVLGCGFLLDKKMLMLPQIGAFIL